MNLSLILKVAESCNINCSYCYMYTGPDQTWRRRPRLMSEKVFANVLTFLRSACAANPVDSIQIIFHGGEPLLLPKERFSRWCGEIVNTIGSLTRLELAVQTNATLVDQEWIDVFQKHSIRVGVSLDGPPEYNDEHRVDHKGNGTYQNVHSGLTLLREAACAGRIDSIGLLCVIDPRRDARKIYRHFVDDLKIEHFDCLLPDFNHAHKPPVPVSEYGRFLCDLFDEWSSREDAEVEIRILSSIISLLIGGPSFLASLGRSTATALTIETDGAIGADDILRSSSPDEMWHGGSVRDVSFADLLSGEWMRAHRSSRSAPSECRNCVWVSACNGGSMLHRYGNGRRYDNRSIYCDALRMTYTKIANYLIARGLSATTLARTLAQ